MYLVEGIANKDKFKKAISHFQNQTFVLIDNKQKRTESDFNLNPFKIDTDDLLALYFNFKNSLFFNRGKQKYSTTYNFIDSKNKTSFAIDNIENKLKSHQIQFTHKISAFWLMDIKGNIMRNKNTSQNYVSRNYSLNSKSIDPKISYVYSQNKIFELSYQYKNKENTIGNFERLNSQKMGASFKSSNQKGTSFSSEFNFFINDYIGNQNSPVAYQMLEGLQPGNNFTWSLLWQQKLTSYLDLNINYLGRKSETSRTIHTGTVQLRAHF